MNGKKISRPGCAASELTLCAVKPFDEKVHWSGNQRSCGMMPWYNSAVKCTSKSALKKMYKSQKFVAIFDVKSYFTNQKFSFFFFFFLWSVATTAPDQVGWVSWRAKLWKQCACTDTLLPATRGGCRVIFAWRQQHRCMTWPVAQCIEVDWCVPWRY